jgi:hypothetical protein
VTLTTAPPLFYCQVVPGKFIAMKGPRRLNEDREWMDLRPGVRDFSPRYLADILRQFDSRVSLERWQGCLKLQGLRL